MNNTDECQHETNMLIFPSAAAFYILHSSEHDFSYDSY